MKFGPAEIGETVEAITLNARFRGTLTAYRDEFAFVSVLGYPETLQLLRWAIVPVR